MILLTFLERLKDLTELGLTGGVSWLGDGTFALGPGPAFCIPSLHWLPAVISTRPLCA